MDAIGGYFSLELFQKKEYHKDAIKLNTGRNCLEYILRAHHYNKVYIPYYTCEVVLEPFHKLGIEYEFYHINTTFELLDDIKLLNNEALLYTNYFGLKQRYVEALGKKYGSQLIVDNTQAFYSQPVRGVDTFYTCRKFFGVPDGAYLYTDSLLDTALEQDYSYERMTFLTKRIDVSAEDAYTDFREESKQLIDNPIREMSKLTQRLMASIDYDVVAEQRRKNFINLHHALADYNHLHLELNENDVPMVYPYAVDNGPELRKKLIDTRVFVARYWPNVLEWTTETMTEYRLALNVLPIPIDQRYGWDDMNYIINTILSL